MSGMRFTLDQLNPKLQQQIAKKLAEQHKGERRMVRNLGPDILPVQKKNKYYAITTEVDGMKFHSKHEAACYRDLKLRELAGEISDLRTQVKFSLFDAGGNCRGEHWGVYTADFVFREAGNLVVSDAKSEATRKARDWPKTKKAMLACHGITIREL